MFEKSYVFFLRILKLGSPLSVRLTRWTGKSKYNIHPKHLIGQINNNSWVLDQIKRTDLVLDLGCNDGSISQLMAKKAKEVVGTDIDTNLLRIAKKRAKEARIENISFEMIDAETKFPFRKNSFDAVVAVDVIEHIDNYKGALREVHRILKKDGRFVLSVPNVDTTWKRKLKKNGFFYYSDFDHKIEFTKSQLQDLLRSHQFKIVSMDVMVYDTPWAGMIDLIGGFSLSLYHRLIVWKINYVKKYPIETTGWKVVCQK